MSRRFQKLLSFVIVLTMVLSMVPAVEVSAATGTVWSGGSFSASGSYYLNGDVTISSGITITSKQNIILDLNGHTITVAEGVQGFVVNGKMTVKDSGTDGTITGSGSDYTGRGGIFYVKGSGAYLTLESGTITGGRATERGGNIYVESGAFNMTGGTVSGGYAGDRGGNICSTGTVNISGGTVIGGNATNYGGNILSTGMTKIIYISGDAVVTEGVSRNGGNIYLMYSTLNMSGGTISKGSASSTGGNLGTYASSDARSTLNISGGSVLDVAADSKAGSMNLTGNEDMPCLVNISGGTLEGRTNAALTASITLSGAPVIENLKLGANMLVTPTDLREGANICISTASGCSAVSGLLSNAASYIPYFSAYEPGYSVGVVDNALALVPGCTCGCGTAPEAVQWTDLTGYTGGTLPSGHYFVPAGGLTLTEQFTVASGASVTLDLRGNTLTAPADSRAFYLYGTLHMMDSSAEESGKLVGGTLVGTSAYGGTIYMDVNGQFYLYSGTVTGGTADRGGNLYIAKSNNVVTLYGGTVSDGTATAISSTTGRGGNIYQTSGELTIKGDAVVSGGDAQRWVTESSGTNNSARGGNIWVTGGICAITGDAWIKDGTSGQYGGNIMAYTSELVISGNAKITGGITEKYARNLVTMNATVTITDNAYIDEGAGTTGNTTYFHDTGSGDAIVNVVTISGGTLEGQTYASKIKTLTLSGAPVIEYLNIAAGMLVTPEGLTEGAEIYVKAVDSTFTGALENAAAEAAYIKPYQSGYAVGVVDNALGYGAGCACGCGELASNITWTSWAGTAITESGHYKLSKAATLPSVITVAEGVDMVIDLNGKTLTAPSEDRAFVVNGSLTILDSASGGKLTGGAPTSGDGGNISVSGGSFTLRSGTITGGTAPRYGGNIVVSSSGIFNMYGGTVSGGYAGERGGNIYKGTGTMYMYGGTITGGTTVNRGGNLFATGGNVYMTGGTLSGGTTTSTSAETYGGNVMITGRTTDMYISGTAKLTAGEADTGTNIAVMYANLYVSGGTISDGTIYSTESSDMNYSGLYFSGGTIGCTTITAGGDMDDGKATLVAITGGTFTGTFKIISASNVILSGAPAGLNLNLAAGVLVTPVNLADGTDITLTATGPFTTQLTNGDDYIPYFTTTSGTITNDEGVLTVNVTQESGTSGNITWVLTTDGTLTLTGTGAMSNYSYSALYSNIPWKSYLSDIKKVVVGEGITTLSNYAFYNCTNLTSVEIASTVTTIGSRTFNGCTSLTSVELPGKLASVGQYAFANTGLTEITLPNSVTTIGNYAFQNCAALETVTLGTGIKTVGTNAFSGCDALTTVYYKGTSSQWDSVTVNSGNTALTGAANVIYSYTGGFVTNAINWNITGGNTLTVSGSGEMPGYYRDTAHSNLRGTPWSAYADQITKVVVTGFTSIGEWAFYDLDKLTTVSIASTVTKIEANAFRDCDGLTTISIPNTVVTLGENAFYGCNKLTTVTLGSGVKTIGNYAFYDCAALTGITIPASVTAIGADAFNGCSAMTAFTVASGNTAYTAANGVLFDKGGLTLLRVPCGFTGSYTVPNTVGTIAENAFANCKGITDVVLTDNVTTVKAGAFFGSSVVTVTLGTGVAAIADTAFNDCSDMTAFICSGNAVYSVDETGALYTADGATLLQVPGGISGTYTLSSKVTTVGKNALAWNRKITRVNIPTSVETVSRYAFADTAFTVLDMTGGTKAVNKGAFESADISAINYQGTELTWAALEVSSYNEPFLAATMTRVNGGVCSETIRWELSNSGVLTITGTGELPVYKEGVAPWYVHGSGITAIVISEGITNISADAFYGCTQVTTVNIPLSLTTVGENAFASCSALAEVNYAGTAFQWKSVSVGSGNTSFTGATFHYSFAALTDITIKTMPTKLDYLMGETLDTTGLVLLLTYSDGFTEEVTTLTEEYQVVADLTTAGTKTVTITYKEKTVSYSVDVASTGSCGESVTWKLLDGVLTLSGTGEMTYYDSKELVPWWSMKETITAVVVEEGITGRISRFAFYNCSNLTTASLPEGITFLGSSAFYGCSSLKEIDIPDSVTSISSTVFGNNSALTTVSFGKALKSVGEGAFKNCTSLTTVNYGGSRTSWKNITINETNNDALTGATVNYALIEPASVYVSKLPDKTEYIMGESLNTAGMVLTTVYDDGSEGEYTGEFAVSCDLSVIGQVQVTVTAGEYTANFQVTVLRGGIADGVKWYIKGSTLYVECEGQMPDYSAENPAPWTVGYYDEFYFDKVVLDEAITSVGAYAFSGCGELTEVTLPDGVTTIGAGAFFGVTNLESVTMGVNVTTIGEDAFANCETLTTVYYGGNSVTWPLVAVGQNNENLTNATFVYGMAEPTGITVTKLPNKTEYLIWETFDATDMEIAYAYEDGETTTPYTGAFSATCEFTAIGEATVTVTAGEYTTTCTVTVLPSGYCSDDGSSLTWKLVDGVLTISGEGEMTYYGSRDLVPWWDYKETVTAAVIESGMTGRLSRFAFYNCSNMKTVSLPEGITFLGSSALYGCSSLEEVVIPNSVTGISSTVFGNNTSLRTVTMGENMESVGEGAFKNCSDLTINYGGSRTTWAAIEVNESNNEAFLTATVNYARVDVTSLEITAQPNKTAYLLGETLDTEGLEITAHKDDGSSVVVTDYTVSADMSAVGNVTVTVSYGGKTAEYLISIGYGGYTADGLFWQYADGILTVDYLVKEDDPGTGVMLDYTAETPAPWAVHAANVQSLVIGEGVTSIGTYAFAGCVNMTSVVIPVGMTSISENAFLNCAALENVTFTGTEAEWRAITIATTGNETLLEAAPVANSTLGDANGDGNVDYQDLGCLQGYLSGKLSEIDLVAADLNGDSNVDYQDLGALQAHLSGKAIIAE